MATIMDSVMSSAKDDAMGASEAPEGWHHGARRRDDERPGHPL